MVTFLLDLPAARICTFPSEFLLVLIFLKMSVVWGNIRRQHFHYFNVSSFLWSMVRSNLDLVERNICECHMVDTVQGLAYVIEVWKIKPWLLVEVEKNVWPAIAEGKVKPVVYKSFPLSEASKAHQLMESSQHIGKILLLPWKLS